MKLITDDAMHSCPLNHLEYQMGLIQTAPMSTNTRHLVIDIGQSVLDACMLGVQRVKCTGEKNTMALGVEEILSTHFKAFQVNPSSCEMNMQTD